MPKIEIQAGGEMMTLKMSVNSMMDQLGASASEVTCVVLECQLTRYFG
jgi:hypothetical protein